MGKKLVSCGIFAAFVGLFSLSASHAQERFAVGDRVEADVLHLKMWKPGVVTEVLPYDRYRVQFDDEIGRHEPTLCLAQFMRKGSGAPPANANAALGQSGSSSSGNASSSGASTSSSSAFKVGQRVLADITQLGKFEPGVITEVLPYDRYRVQLDGEAGGYGPLVTLGKNMKASSGSPALAQQHDVNHGAAPSQRPPVHNVPAPKPQPSPAATAADDGLPKGRGTPPDGVYVAQKISPGGTLIGLGKLIIRGGTYSGIAGGGFAPYSVNGGNITWSAGITGLPDGWRIRRSVYAGTDKQGRPYIQIYYVSKSGFNDMFDCLRE